MNGILVIDKPEGLTSHDVVARLRRILKTKKIGHTGTLDPFATGVLVMLVGKATRLAQFLDKDEKTYEALIRFGYETDTGDKTGEPISDCGFGISDLSGRLEQVDWESVLEEFRGVIEQVPPMYSAKKVKGKKLYELARQGVEIERKPVKVNIYELELLEPPKSKIQNPKSKIIVSCSAGTYIRTLAEDIGRKIGVPCHLEELRRTKAGKFGIEQAVTLAELERTVEAGETVKIPVSMNEAVAHLPERSLDAAEIKHIQNGRKVDASFESGGVQQVRLTDAAGSELIAIGDYDDKSKLIQPRMVFLS
jgi:tRNA pseudouridine55 synthase